jgi:hypothetical protein
METDTEIWTVNGSESGVSKIGAARVKVVQEKRGKGEESVWRGRVDRQANARGKKHTEE